MMGQPFTDAGDLNRALDLQCGRLDHVLETEYILADALETGQPAVDFPDQLVEMSPDLVF